MVTHDESTVSEDGAKVVLACLELTKADLYPVLAVGDVGDKIQEVDFTVQYKPDVPKKIKLVVFGPQDPKESSCKVTKNGHQIVVNDPDDVVQDIPASWSVTMTCKRLIKPVTIDGVNANCTDETIFVVATEGPVKFINVPRSCTQVIAKSEASKLQKEIDSTNIEIGRHWITYESELKDLGSRVPALETKTKGLETEEDRVTTYNNVIAFTDLAGVSPHNPSCNLATNPQSPCNDDATTYCRTKGVLGVGDHSHAVGFVGSANGETNQIRLFCVDGAAR